MRTIVTYVKGCHVDEIVEQDCATSGRRLWEARKKKSKSCWKIKNKRSYLLGQWPSHLLSQRWDGYPAGMWERKRLHPVWDWRRGLLRHAAMRLCPEQWWACGNHFPFVEQMNDSLLRIEDSFNKYLFNFSVCYVRVQHQWKGWLSPHRQGGRYYTG